MRRHQNLPTEVQRVGFVGYTGGEGGSPRLWNLQNLHAVLGCEHKSGEDCPTGRNYYVCNLFFVFFLQLLGQSTLNFGEGKKSVELSPSG